MTVFAVGPRASARERERDCAWGAACPLAWPFAWVRRLARSRSRSAVCGVTVREVAVLAMLDEEAEWGGVWRVLSSGGFGVGDWEGVKGARVCMRPFAFGRTVCGVAVWVDEEDTEESDGAGEVERDGVDEDEEDGEDEEEGAPRKKERKR